MVSEPTEKRNNNPNIFRLGIWPRST